MLHHRSEVHVSGVTSGGGECSLARTQIQPPPAQTLQQQPARCSGLPQELLGGCPAAEQLLRQVEAGLPMRSAAPVPAASGAQLLAAQTLCDDSIVSSHATALAQHC